MKKITKIFTYFVLMILLISGCSCKKDKDNKANLQIGDMNATTYVNIDIKEYNAKISNKDDFILFVYSNDCMGCRMFKPKLESVIQEKHLIVYGIETSEIKGISKDNDLYKLKYTPTIIIYKEGKNIFYSLSDNDLENFDTKEKFVSLLDKYTNMPTLYYINKAQLKEKITNKENFIIYYSRSTCGDCSYLNKNYMKEYLNSNTKTKHFYIIETDVEGIRRVNGEVNSEQWQAFKNEFGLSNVINTELGHGAGYVPTLQYYNNGEIKEMMVYFNDFNDATLNADGSYSVTIDNSYYSDNPYIGQTINYSEYQKKLAPFYNEKLKTFLDTNLTKVD